VSHQMSADAHELQPSRVPALLGPLARGLFAWEKIDGDPNVIWSVIVQQTPTVVPAQESASVIQVSGEQTVVSSVDQTATVQSVTSSMSFHPLRNQTPI